MSLRINRFWRRIGFRISLWYSCIFLGSAALLLFLTHLLLASILEQRDKQSIQLKLQQLALYSSQGGVDTIRKNAGQEFYVRLTDSSNKTLFLKDLPDLREDYDLSPVETKTLEHGSWVRLQERDEQDEWEPWET